MTGRSQPSSEALLPCPLQEQTNEALIRRIEELEGALRDTLCELTACAVQLAVRGLKGHEGDSVSRAQARARAALQPKAR